LRVQVHVPQDVALQLKPGMEATLMSRNSPAANLLEKWPARPIRSTQTHARCSPKRISAIRIEH
jgi:hypothetical protein